MTKEQLLALKRGPTVKHNSQYPVPTLSVETRRVILTHHDLQKRDAKMDGTFIHGTNDISPLVKDSETYQSEKTLCRKKNENNGLKR